MLKPSDTILWIKTNFPNKINVDDDVTVFNSDDGTYKNKNHMKMSRYLIRIMMMMIDDDDDDDIDDIDDDDTPSRV